MDNLDRNKEHQKVDEIEAILNELENLIGPVEPAGYYHLSESNLPVVFIMGCARSGSTLLLQLLADTGVFCYPTNLMSRFYYAPYIGALLQRLLVDLDVKGEVFGQGQSDSLGLFSELGKTKGAASPHEFWYFWRRFFKFGPIQQLSKENLQQVDKKLFLQELAAIQAVFRKPLVMKGMIMNWHIPFLADLIKNVHFIFIERDILFNAQSLLQARENFFGDKSKWYSFRPPEFNALKELTPEEQVVQQVHFTNKAIKKGLNQIEDKKVTHVSYEELCNDPQSIIKRVFDHLGVTVDLSAETKLRKGNQQKVSSLEWSALNKAVASIYE